MNLIEYDWDVETYPNFFSAGFYNPETNDLYQFEISDRVDHSAALIEFIEHLMNGKHWTWGFNNEHFDYPVVHEFLQRWWFSPTPATAHDIFLKAQSIIDADWRDRFDHVIWPRDRYFRQGDLFTLHHFDNVARSTSLKKLQINMRSKSVVDLPYAPGSYLDDHQKDVTLEYMRHDITETSKFRKLSAEQIAFRRDLAEKYPDLGDVVNFNDTKIGKKFFERELERVQPGICYERGTRQKRQTHRDRIRLGDVIIPYITFRDPQLQAVLDQLKAMTIYETKAAFKLHASVNGFTFDFGTGGIHGSIDNTIVEADDDHDIIDVDVASFYPNLAITNGFYPEHLSQTFCDVYSQLYQMRKGFPKKSAENGMLKLALNGVYGDSNSVYSPFYDPQYTMSITVNGQLLLCMLADWIVGPGVQMIQANTDGITVRIRKDLREWFMSVCKHWELTTGLELEYADYSKMAVRDVNNYIAVKTDGSVKRIGAYAYETAMENPYTREMGWHKDQSCLVSVKAAEAYLVHGTPVAEFIQNHDNAFDFMIMAKVRKSDRLELADGTVMQSTMRYFVSRSGQAMFKHMPPLPATPDRPRRNAVQAGWTVTPCNDVDDFDWNDINWLYYTTEANKLISGFIACPP